MSTQLEPEYIHRLDVEKFDSLGNDERYGDELLNRADWVGSCALNYISTPPGLGSPRGMHTHPYDQVFFIVKGVMDIEVEGKGHHRLNPGDVAIFPAHTPHRNWNDGDIPVVHLSLNSPLPADESK